MSRKTALLLMAVLLAGALGTARARGITCGACHAGGTPDGQGLIPVGGIGGAARAVAVLADGVLLAEGETLVRLDASGNPTGWLALGRGAVQDLAVLGGTAYALTESGLATVGLTALVERAFLPGGGQALAVTDRFVYAAAQQVGLRVAVLGRDGLPGGWTVLATPGAAVDVVLGATGSTLYVALGEGGIGVYDLAAPEAPALLGQVGDLGAVETVTASTGRLFAGSGHRLGVFDLTDPAAPALLYIYDPLHDARAVVLRGEWAYIADAVGGLKRYAIGSLDAPRLGGVVWPGTAFDVADDGRYLYVAAGWDGVIVLDAGRRDSLLQRGRAAPPGQATAVAVSGSRGLVGMGPDGVAVVDWGDVDAPRLAATLPLEGTVRAVALRGAVGFAAVEEVGVAIFSVADMDAPRLLTTVPLDTPPESLALSGTLVYVAAGEGGLVILETIRPAEPVVVGRLLPPRDDLPVHHVTLEGKRAYLCAGAALLIADVDAPDDPRLLAAVPMPAVAAVARNFIVYAVGARALTTINAASSSEPGVLGAYRAVDVIRDVAVQGERLWLAGQGDGATAVGLAASMPTVLPDGMDAAGAVHETVTFGEGGSGRGLAWPPGADGPLLAAGMDGLLRLGADGAVVIRQGLFAGERLSQTTDGRLLVGGAGWAVLGWDDPAQVRVLAGAGSPGAVSGMAGAGEAVFLAADDEGVFRRDLGTGTLLRGSPSASDGAARDVATDGAFVFVAEDGPGEGGALRVLAADSLGTVTAVPLPGRARAVAWQEGRAYVVYAAGEAGGLAVLDVDAPTAGLRAVGGAAVPAVGLALTADGRLAYAAGGSTLTILDLSAWPDVRPLRRMTLPQAITRLSLDEEGRRLLGLLPGRSVLIFELGDPFRPTPVAALETPALDLALVGETLYLAAGEAGLQRASLATLDDLAGRVVAVDAEPTSALWLDGATLYAAGPTSWRAYALDGQGDAVLVASVPTGDIGPLRGLAGRVTRRDGRWLYAGTDDGLWAVQHAPDGALAVPGRLALTSALDVLAAAGDRLYLRSSSDPFMPGLDVLLLADSVTPAGTFALPLAPIGQPETVLAWEERVLVGSEAGVAALEWAPSGGELAAVLGTLDGLPGTSVAVQVADSVAWIAAEEGGVWRVDVHDPAAPRLEAVIETPGEAHGLALSPQGDRLAVATGACGLRLLDLGANPPREVGFWRGMAVTDVAAVGDLYAVVGADGVTLLRESVGDAPALPSMPLDPDPPDGAEGVGQAVVLRWEPEPDPCERARYEVWAGVDGAALTQVAMTSTTTAALNDLPPEATITWQVQATDAQGDTVQGPRWTFHTGRVALATPRQASLAGGRVAAPTPAPLLAEAEADSGGASALLWIGGLLLTLLLAAGLWRWRR